MARHRRGTIILRSGRFYVRYSKGGKKVAVYFCDEDGEHWARRRRGRLEVSPSVQRKHDEQMLRVNEDHASRRPASKPLTFGEFWTEHFVPSMKTRALALRTVKGYEETWEYLKPSIAQRRLDEFLGMHECKQRLAGRKLLKEI